MDTHAPMPSMLKSLESPHIHGAFELGRIRTALTIALLITFVVALIALAANGTSELDTGLGTHQITGALQAPQLTNTESRKASVPAVPAALGRGRPSSRTATIP